MVYHAAGRTILGADEFLLHPAANERTELVRGHIRMMTPASAPHGVVSANVCRLLATYVRQHPLGVCFADSTGYALPNLAEGRSSGHTSQFQISLMADSPAYLIYDPPHCIYH